MRKNQLIASIFVILFAISHTLCANSYAAALRELTGKDKYIAEEYLNSAKKAFSHKEYLIAEDYCQRIINSYPDTTYATKAKKVLKNTQRKEKGCLIWLGR